MACSIPFHNPHHAPLSHRLFVPFVNRPTHGHVPRRRFAGRVWLVTSPLLRDAISIPAGDDAPLDGRASYPIRPFPREIKGASELMLVP